MLSVLCRHASGPVQVRSRCCDDFIEAQAEHLVASMDKPTPLLALVQMNHAVELKDAGMRFNSIMTSAASVTGHVEEAARFVQHLRTQLDLVTGWRNPCACLVLLLLFWFLFLVPLPHLIFHEHQDYDITAKSIGVSIDGWALRSVRPSLDM